MASTDASPSSEPQKPTRQSHESSLTDSEAQFRTLFDFAPDAIAVVDVDSGRFVDVNPAAEILYGLTRAELLERGPAEVSPTLQPDGRSSTEAARAYVQEAFDGGHPIFPWTHINSRTGREIPCEVRLVRLPAADQNLVRGSIVDISPRIQAANLLRSQRNLALRLGEATDLEETLDAFLEAAMTLADMDCGGVYLFDEEGREFFLANSRGLTPSYVEAVARGPAESPKGRLIMAGSPVWVEADTIDGFISEAMRPEGLRSLAILPIKDKSRVIGCINIGSHEHERLKPEIRAALEATIPLFESPIARAQAAEKLREREQERRAHLFFLESLERIDEAIRGTPDLDGMMQDCVEVVLSLFECDRAYLLHPCDPDAETARVEVEATSPDWPGAKALDREIPIQPDLGPAFERILAADGPYIVEDGPDRPAVEWVRREFNVQAQMVSAIRPRTGKPWLLGIQQCSHQRAWTEAESRLFQEVGRRIGDGLSSVLFFRDLAKSEERYRLLATNASDVIWTSDLDGVITFVTPSVMALRGLSPEQVVGHALMEALPPESALLAEEALGEERELDATGRIGPDSARTVESEMYHEDGSHLWVETTFSFLRDEDGEAVGFLGISRNITGRKEAESEKDLLEEQLRQSQKMEAVGRLAGGVAHDFNNIMTGISGYAELLLDAAEPGDPFRKDLEEIRKAGERAAGLTNQLLAFSRKQVIAPRVIRPNEVLDRSQRMLRRIIGEDIQLEFLPGDRLWHIKADPAQLDQILVNLSVNARDAMPGGGRLTIETRNVKLDEADARTVPDAEPGPHVMLAVSDTGHGMDEETKDRVFEPFFTTKGKDQGTGLGLATVYGIVMQNQGSVVVDSRPGQGSTFRIYFPREFEEAEDLGLRPEKAPAQGKETILLVEDEQMVRSLASRILARQGYKVLEASDGGGAYLECSRFDGPIDLLLTDMIMPGMNGLELHERLLELRPDLKVLFMSGYTEDVIADKRALNREAPFLQKPFNIASLTGEVRRVLDEE